ncbi:UNKNOWN [Stylonychia lemnae]|uniref:Uncharacterized protein n=1 Tax=Stylonychia lemnae TaxID=5949 RepID=A0A078AH46_STYLE|nr:UNKNOWN [Stylonychia lemnae]|eukprot:CDW80842.1 UNKNOWN [Stylonychia lemnae]
MTMPNLRLYRVTDLNNLDIVTLQKRDSSITNFQFQMTEVEIDSLIYYQDYLKISIIQEIDQSLILKKIYSANGTNADESILLRFVKFQDRTYLLVNCITLQQYQKQDFQTREKFRSIKLFRPESNILSANTEQQQTNNVKGLFKSDSQTFMFKDIIEKQVQGAIYQDIINIMNIQRYSTSEQLQIYPSIYQQNITNQVDKTFKQELEFIKTIYSMLQKLGSLSAFHLRLYLSLYDKKSLAARSINQIVDFDSITLQKVHTIKVKSSKFKYEKGSLVELLMDEYKNKKRDIKKDRMSFDFENLIKFQKD